jgi:hypothetical protein
MLLKPILSGRIAKWAYADFIVDHAIEVDHSIRLIQLSPWRLYLDGSVCAKGQGARCVIASPSGVDIDLSVILEFACTNN